jgi:hypothetical protein
MLLTKQQKHDFEVECKRSENVLHTLFPSRLVEDLQSLVGTSYLEYHEVSAILSTDIVGKRQQITTHIC